MTNQKKLIESSNIAETDRQTEDIIPRLGRSDNEDALQAEELFGVEANGWKMQDGIRTSHMERLHASGSARCRIFWLTKEISPFCCKVSEKKFLPLFFRIPL